MVVKMKTPPRPTVELTPELAAALGTRRAALLRRIVRRHGQPPEVMLDLALTILDLASTRLAPSPITRQAVSLGAARWRNVDSETRTKLMRQAVQVRWAKRREAQSLIES